MSKMKDLYIELLNQFDGQIPKDFDFEKYIETKIKEKNKKKEENEKTN
jgi:hypothetical protein